MAISLTNNYITGQQRDYYGHASFVEEQATLARRAIQKNSQYGDKLLQHLQGWHCTIRRKHRVTETKLFVACILMTWYYWYSAK